MPPLNLWFAFRLAFTRGGVVYYHNLRTTQASLGKPDELKLRGSRNAEEAAAKPDELEGELEGELEAAQERAVVAAQSAWMEFTLEYTKGARRQLLRLWLTLRVVCIGVALLYLVVFLCMMLYVPSVDLYGPDPVEAGAIQNVIHSAVALAVALVFTPANRGRFVAWLGALGKSGIAATARRKATVLRSRVDELRLKNTKGKLSQEEQSELSSSEEKLKELEPKVQQQEAEGKATALAALIGKLSPAEALKLGTERFRALPLAELKCEEIAGRKAGAVANDWKSSPGWPTQELFAKTFMAKFGKVDAFVSHSWSDDGDAKFDRLHKWATEENEKTNVPMDDTAGSGASELTYAGAAGKVTDDGNGGIVGVTIWLDKACLDQRDIQASLAGLPFFISGCKQLLVLAGPTYASRLWCVMELFVFVQLTPRVQEKMRVMNLTSEDKTEEVSKVFQYGLKNFDAGKAETFDPNDRERLMAVIEAAFGTFDPFNKIVQDISKFHDKVDLTRRSKVKGSAPELLTRVFDDPKKGINAAQTTHSRRKFKDLSKKEKKGAKDKEKSRDDNTTKGTVYV